MREPLPDWARTDLETILRKLEVADEGIELPQKEGEPEAGDISAEAEFILPYEELTNARAMVQWMLNRDELLRRKSHGG